MGYYVVSSGSFEVLESDLPRIEKILSKTELPYKDLTKNKYFVNSFSETGGADSLQIADGVVTVTIELYSSRSDSYVLDAVNPIRKYLRKFIMYCKAEDCEVYKYEMINGRIRPEYAQIMYSEDIAQRDRDIMYALDAVVALYRKEHRGKKPEAIKEAESILADAAIRAVLKER